MVHASLSQLQICFVAFCADAGLIWVLFRAINAQSSRDVSEIAEGPFKFAEDSIDRMVSVEAEYSNSSASIIELISLQAALDVTEEENARAVRSTARDQWPLNAVTFESGPVAMLLQSIN
jgi:hypothetical protein